jgi:DNA polymerase
MTVDDVMRAIGAINAGGSKTAEPAESSGHWRKVLSETAPSAGGLEAPADEPELFDDDIMRLASLKAIEKSVAKCTRCRLYKTALNPVPGEGNPKAGLVCVGEAPGANEDQTGRPFVGAAGNLLNKILAAVELRREDVFICNVLKHRPPGNRNPLPDEVAACSPYLVRQLELIKPKVIVAFGSFAAQTLLETKAPIGKLRGLVHQYHGIPLIVTYHPAALLRNPAWKRPTWEDVKLARRILDSPPRA